MKVRVEANAVKIFDNKTLGTINQGKRFITLDCSWKEAEKLSQDQLKKEKQK